MEAPPLAAIKQKKPLTAAQIAKIEREKLASERILRNTGVKVPPSVGARLLKMEREGGNVKTFLNSIKSTGKGLTRKAPATASASPAPGAGVGAPATKPKTVRKPRTVKTVKTVKPTKTMKTIPEAVTALAPELAPMVANVVKQAEASLTEDEHKILSQCERITEKLVSKTRKNLQNALGRNANNLNVKRLVNIRKSGTNLPMSTYLKLASGQRKSKATRKGKALGNIAPKVTKKEQQALQAFLASNA